MGFKLPIKKLLKVATNPMAAVQKVTGALPGGNIVNGAINQAAKPINGAINQVNHAVGGIVPGMPGLPQVGALPDPTQLPGMSGAGVPGMPNAGQLPGLPGAGGIPGAPGGMPGAAGNLMNIAKKRKKALGFF